MSFISPTNLWRIGALYCAGGMAAGAFGAHGLKSRGFALDKIHAWETASSYAIYNGLALLVISSHSRFAVHKFAGPAIAIGAAVFSGTVFALVLNRDRFKFLGPITPLGGTAMMLGFVSLAF